MTHDTNWQFHKCLYEIERLEKEIQEEKEEDFPDYGRINSLMQTLRRWEAEMGSIGHDRR